MFHDINTQDWLRPAYFATARDSVQTLIGNELAMQKRINLSVQMPDDDKSVLPVHADVWSGDSAFEAVLWVPFVDVFASKSMFISRPPRTPRSPPVSRTSTVARPRIYIARLKPRSPSWKYPMAMSWFSIKTDARQPRQPRGGNALVDELSI